MACGGGFTLIKIFNSYTHGLTGFDGFCGAVSSVADHHWLDPCPGCVSSDRYCAAGRKQSLEGHY